MSARALVLDRDALFARAAEWDALVARSRTPSVFLRAGWLRACADALHGDAPVVAVVAIAPEGWRGAAVWAHGPAGWTLLGHRASDYLDIPIDRALTDAATDEVVALLLEASFAATGARSLLLPALCDRQALREHIGRSRFAANVVRRTVAPSMEAKAFEAATRKKSLKRHWNRLHREGDVSIRHLRSAAEVQPVLPELFEQHRARWHADGLPSQFDEPEQRRLYELLTDELDAMGALRFTEVRLDGKLVAAHFGMHAHARTTWYKPSFDPAFRAHSPGEVLLRALVLEAIDEGADEFDFTVGDEPFKFRFATVVRDVVDVRVWPARAPAALERARLGAREWAKQRLPGLTRTMRQAMKR